ncbi:MAG: 4Fe-4S binding protein [Candidatus Thorarchaeota archaeon]
MSNINEKSEKNLASEKVKHPKRQMTRKILLFISFMLFPVTIFYFSPYLSIVGPVFGFITASLLVFGSLFIFSLFLGRIFCSYICPMGGMQDAMATIRTRRIQRRSFFVKWLIFIPWIIVIILLPILFAKSFNGIDFFFGMDNQEIGLPGISILSIQGIAIYYGIVAILLILGFAVGKRSFCHHVCWVGPFMVIGRKLANWLRIPSLRLQSDTSKCNQCKRCDRTCPMSLEVHTFVKRGDMEDSNCILCGNCIEECPRNVIHYTFKSHQKAKSEPLVEEK